MSSPTRDGSPRPAWLHVVDRLSVAAFALAWLAVGWQAGSTLPPSRLLLLFACAIAPAILLADLASGLVHWFADRYLDPETPILGPMLIEPFREHHRDPAAMTRHDFFEVSGNNGLVTLPLAGLLLAIGLEPEAGLAWQLTWMTLLLFALAVLLTNQIHAWAHEPTPTGWVRRLQRRGLILSPETHARHHANGFDRAYCVTTGWLNPWLDRVGAFRALESGLAHVGLRLAMQARREGRAR